MIPQRTKVVLPITGELDVAGATAAHKRLLGMTLRPGDQLVLDLSQLTFMDSTGIRLLITAHARSRTDGDRLMLVRPPARVFRVLTIAGVDELLPFAE